MIENINNELLNFINDPRLILKKTTPFEVGKITPLSDNDWDDESRREHLILCKLCSNIITSPDNCIVINGKHQHTFKNPVGYTYQIGCFINAKGCIITGEPTTDFTWFSGFSWCYAICSICHIHLGWYYQSKISSFYGLILNHLIENV
ncbi:MAG: cereblon family protein [Spirochaetota bacterium]|nr:cereblon family protein [Spirochaetota bacterium]